MGMDHGPGADGELLLPKQSVSCARGPAAQGESSPLFLQSNDPSWALGLLLWNHILQFSFLECPQMLPHSAAAFLPKGKLFHLILWLSSLLLTIFSLP